MNRLTAGILLAGIILLIVFFFIFFKLFTVGKAILTG
jgi:hypothetical protein